jgi:two-component system, response regulator YesN
MTMYKLMIVDDELLMRIGIRSMVDWESHGFRLAGEAANGKEALDLALRVSPDLIVTDIKMPVLDGLCLIREISKALTGCKFVILSNFDEIGYVKEALRLGASDYLIKSEITPDALIELLAGIRAKLQLASGVEAGRFPLPIDYSESMTHLKERLFKDLISGLLDDKEAAAKAEQLQLRVRSNSLVVAKLRIDRFEDVRKKYVEKDENLLRFSVMNILEEVIPRSQLDEVVVESSAEYLLIHNTRTTDDREARADLEKLCAGIMTTMRDFMNLSFSVGVSSVAAGFKQLRTAYSEADSALQRRFFAGFGQLLFFADTPPFACRRERIESVPGGEHELAFRDALDSNNEGRIVAFLDEFRDELDAMRADERSTRDAYIRLTEIVNSLIPVARIRQDGDQSTYEAVLSAETRDDIHRIVSEYACRTVTGGRPSDQAGYADMAAEMIHRYYAEDISLQSVAGQINVHPSYLSRVFKQEKGENFVSYLTRIRVERAKSLLKGHMFKVYEVADKVGYHNYTYFSKLFKKVVGVSPEEYRESSDESDGRRRSR